MQRGDISALLVQLNRTEGRLANIANPLNYRAITIDCGPRATVIEKSVFTSSVRLGSAKSRVSLQKSTDPFGFERSKCAKHTTARKRLVLSKTADSGNMPSKGNSPTRSMLPVCGSSRSRETEEKKPCLGSSNGCALRSRFTLVI